MRRVTAFAGDPTGHVPDHGQSSEMRHRECAGLAKTMYQVLIQLLLAALGGIRLGWQKLHRTGGLNAPIGAKLPTGDA